jgi:hypothetical protein
MTYVANALTSGLQWWTSPVFWHAHGSPLASLLNNFIWAATFVECVTGVLTRAEGMGMNGWLRSPGPGVICEEKKIGITERIRHLVPFY